MSYNIRRSDGTVQVIPDNVIDNSKYSIRLPGRGVFNYGEDYAETIVRMLENFAADTPPLRSIPGQLWYDKAASTLKINMGTNDTTPVWAPAAFLGAEGNPVPSVFATAIGSATTRVSSLFVNNIGTASAKVTQLHVDTVGTSSNPATAMYATNFNGTASSARWADLAEKYFADSEYEAGTLVSFGGKNQITIATNKEMVFSVISDKPGYVLNQNDDPLSLPVVLHGMSPVKIVGPVMKHQYIELSYMPGVAIATNIKTPNTVGRALESNEGNEIKLVNCYIRAGF